jgi:Flp pilus assembly protein TadD
MKLTYKKVWMIALTLAVAVGLTAPMSPAWAGDVERLMNQGMAYYKQGQYDAAAACFQDVLRLRPNYAQAHNELGCVYYQMGLFYDAVDAFYTALQLDPNHKEAHSNLGYISAQAGDFEGAMAEYRWLKSRYPATAQKLGNLIAAKKAEVSDTDSEDFIEEEGEWVTILDETADPDQPVTSSGPGQSQNKIKEAEDWHYKGVQYRAAHRDRDAFAAFTKAVQLDPNKAEYWEYRARSA